MQDHREETRQCKVCGDVKPLATYKANKRGRPYFLTMCRGCIKRRARANYHLRMSSKQDTVLTQRGHKECARELVERAASSMLIAFCVIPETDSLWEDFLHVGLGLARIP